MISGQVRAAIVGAGLMGRWHADAIQRVGGVVAIVADPDPDRGAALAEEFGASSTVRTGDALTRQLVDVVHVTTPPSDHAYAIRAAMESNLHVLAEKPLAPSAAVTAELYSMAATRSLLLCPVHQSLFQPGIVKLLHAAPGLGRIRQVAAVICTAGVKGGDDAARDQLVCDVVPHPLSLAARLIPGGISGTRWQVSRAAAGEVQISGSKDGVSISILMSTRGRPPRNVLSVTGETGSMHADLYHGFAFGEHRTLSKANKIVRPFGNAAGTLTAATTNLARRIARREQAFPGLRELVRKFYDAVKSDGMPPISVSETLDVAVERDTIIRALRLEGAKPLN
ncbi:MAG TPA: Gfo/Idh/MocA family oxidoreductase [Gemmatimonadaceae bacterium]|nr:Gfo/Idh/MocA family oxidoreductase [Gemmatimonadaceae bacterium]